MLTQSVGAKTLKKNYTKGEEDIKLLMDCRDITTNLDHI